jgi:hypothetical protein
MGACHVPVSVLQSQYSVVSPIMMDLKSKSSSQKVCKEAAAMCKCAFTPILQISWMGTSKVVWQKKVNTLLGC